jgi:hypothetical protein
MSPPRTAVGKRTRVAHQNRAFSLIKKHDPAQHTDRTLSHPALRRCA